MLSRNIKESIDRYVDTGCPTGQFLYAVMTNNLFEAAGRADQFNGPGLLDICRYLYNYTPAPCWGSVEKVADWLKLHQENPEKAELIASADREQRKNYQ